jgi:hypothetical protein
MRAAGISLCVLLSSLTAVPASAQQERAQQEPSWETQFLLIANPCLTGQISNRLEVCQQANAELVTRAASYAGPLPKHEDNVYRAMRAVVAIAIASEMGQADHARSKRSCDAIEQGWSDAALIDPQSSPQRVVEMQTVRTQMLSAVRMCRQSFGPAPSWAPELPAS